MTDDLVGRQTVHVRDNLDAYYYGFDPTGNADVDRILGAIAYAGKAYHHTEDWDDASVIGVSCVGNIQNAAALAAARIEALEAAIRTIMARCEAIEDEATDALVLEKTEHGLGFLRGEKRTAKSIRRHLHDLTRAALTLEAPHAD